MGEPHLLPDEDKTATSTMATRLGRLARRVLIYGCVGLAVSLFYSLVVILLMQFPSSVSPTVASIVAFIVTLPAAYLSHAKVSFSDRSFDSFQPLRFALTTAASFVVSTGGMYWITEVANRSYLLGIAWTWLMVPAMNLSIYMLWVFRTTRSTGRV